MQKNAAIDESVPSQPRQTPDKMGFALRTGQTPPLNQRSEIASSLSMQGCSELEDSSKALDNKNDSNLFTEVEDDEEMIRCFLRTIHVEEDGTILVSELSAAMERHPETPLAAALIDRVKSESDGNAITQELLLKVLSELPRVRGGRVGWARTLGLEGTLARLLPVGDVFDGLAGIKALRGEALERALNRICTEFFLRLPAILKGAFDKLNHFVETTNLQSFVNKKFEMDGARVGRFATLEDFYKGPESLIGVANPRIREGIEKEHRHRSDAKSSFVTSNYQIETRPELEWEFVVSPSSDYSLYPHTPFDKTKWEKTHEHGIHKDQWHRWSGIHGRDVIKLSDFLKSVQIEMLRSDLLEEEAICLRLYTGPMYHLYNMSLRGFRKEDFEPLDGNR
jgi:hypothetical protein